MATDNKLAKRTPSTNTIIKRAEEHMTRALESTAEILSNAETPVPVVVRLYNLLNADWKKAIEAQREAVREALLAMNDRGLFKDGVHDGRVAYSVRVTDARSKEPDMARLLAAAKEKGLSPEAVADPVVDYAFNAEKAAKYFTPEELDAMRKPMGRRLEVRAH